MAKKNQVHISPFKQIVEAIHGLDVSFLMRAGNPASSADGGVNPHAYFFGCYEEHRKRLVTQSTPKKDLVLATTLGKFVANKPEAFLKAWGVVIQFKKDLQGVCLPDGAIPPTSVIEVSSSIRQAIWIFSKVTPAGDVVRLGHVMAEALGGEFKITEGHQFVMAPGALNSNSGRIATLSADLSSNQSYDFATLWETCEGDRIERQLVDRVLVASVDRQKAIPLSTFLRMDFVPDKQLLGPVLLEKSIGMIAGPRGGGKSWLALFIARAVAGGSELEPWGKGLGVPVTVLDGEMRAAGLQERMKLMHSGCSDPAAAALASDNVYIISRDCYGDSIGTIDAEDGQKAIDELIPSGTKLLIIDNLSAWTSGGQESSNSWAIIKTWLTKKRLDGVAVLLIHHAGKNGAQRGSSAHEDLLDYSILISTLAGSTDREDTRFLIKHTKLRDFIPSLRQDSTFAFWTEGDQVKFEVTSAQGGLSEEDQKMLKMHAAGTSMELIGKEVGLTKSTVSRRIKKFKELGLAPSTDTDVDNDTGAGGDDHGADGSDLDDDAVLH